MNIQTVGILGAGTMGNGIAHVFARCGYNVVLRDIEKRFLDHGLDTITRNLDREVKKAKITEADKSDALARV
ncbi:MAG TPA: 3-hydroxyacyl-CoA dehydrogenase NAD-binding domain-containing protein, partial [Candidatus Acidoferrales bacterium]|nr:3-hydroxyacyl-CoA dehydrogenase NAD-binding domain-containing protein [Candidatus Acidoferrales bacterium]